MSLTGNSPQEVLEPVLRLHDHLNAFILAVTATRNGTPFPKSKLSSGAFCPVARTWRFQGTLRSRASARKPWPLTSSILSKEPDKVLPIQIG